MADIYADMGDWDAAFTYALRSLKLARQYGLKEQISNAYLKLSQLYEKTGIYGSFAEILQELHRFQGQRKEHCNRAADGGYAEEE